MKVAFPFPHDFQVHFLVVCSSSKLAFIPSGSRIFPLLGDAVGSLIGIWLKALACRAQETCHLRHAL